MRYSASSPEQSELKRPTILSVTWNNGKCQALLIQEYNSLQPIWKTTGEHLRKFGLAFPVTRHVLPQVPDPDNSVLMPTERLAGSSRNSSSHDTPTLETVQMHIKDRNGQINHGTVLQWNIV